MTPLQGSRIAALLLVAVLAVAGCGGPPDDVDVVSGASVMPAAEMSGDRLRFESAGMQLVLEELAATSEVIWALDFIDAETLVFTERRGQVRLLNLSDGTLTDLTGGPVVKVTDSGGLFDVLVDPDFANNGFLYFTFVKGLGEQSVIALARSRLEGDGLVDTTELFVANNPSSDHAHWGSRVVMDAGRFLYMTSGDRHVPDNAQDLASHGGKVLRLLADGSAPADNPFVGAAGAAAEVWSLGHRNPQGLVLHGSGLLLEQEHGPTGGDEINLIARGLNYGWPVITWGENIWGGQLPEGTTKPGMQQPLRYFKPGIAPTGIAVYTGEALPGWRGNLFSSTLRGPLYRLEFDVAARTAGADESLLAEWRERLRDVVQGPDGLLYVATESGRIARISPAE